jgi:hypothetical protein
MTEGDDQAAVSRNAWIGAFAERIGVEPPGPGEIDDLLELAATAAHASHRTAAPLACWLAGQSGMTPEELKRAAEEIPGSA